MDSTAQAMTLQDDYYAPTTTIYDHSVLTTDQNDDSDNEVDSRVAMMVIGSLGLIGNGFVVFVIFSFTKMRRKVPNLFIINQSAIDFVVGIVLIGDAATKYVSGYTVELTGTLGDFYCKIWISRLLQWSMLVSSTYNLVAITIERYMMVVFPIKYKTAFTRKRATVAIVVVWLTGLCFNLTHLSTHVVRDGICYYFSSYTSAAWQTTYGIATITFQFFIPMSIHIALYGHMVVVLKKRSKSVVHQQQQQQQQANKDNKMNRAQKNLLKTQVIVTVCFFLCWAWNQLAFFVYNLGVHYDLTSKFHLFTIAAVNTNCCVNPFIYIAKYDEFQKAVLKMIGRSKVQPTAGETTATVTETAETSRSTAFT